MIYFNIVRIFLIIWSAVMISLIDNVGIHSKGDFELEHSNKDTYSKVLILAVGSFLGDAAFKLKNKSK